MISVSMCMYMLKLLSLPHSYHSQSVSRPVGHLVWHFLPPLYLKKSDVNACWNLPCPGLWPALHCGLSCTATRPQCRTGHSAGQATVQDRPQCRTDHSAGQATVQDRPQCRAGHSAGQATVQDRPQCRTGHSAGAY